MKELEAKVYTIDDVLQLAVVSAVETEERFGVQAFVLLRDPVGNWRYRAPGNMDPTLLVGLLTRAGIVLHANAVTAASAPPPVEQPKGSN